jgi:hypothetical protein
MNPIILSKGLLPPNINVSLFTIPAEYSYMLCNLFLTAANGNGMAFTAWITLDAVPQNKDTIANYPTATSNADGMIFNNLKIPNLIVGPGESIVLNTAQIDISYRLTGYGVPAINNTGLMLPNAVDYIG